MRKFVRTVIIAPVFALMFPCATFAADEGHYVSHERIEAGASEQSIGPEQFTSCKVFQYRIIYDLVRQGQNAELANRLSKKLNASEADIENVKRFANRLRSRPPSYGKGSLLVIVAWTLKDMRPDTVELLRSELNVAPKYFRFADTEWQTSNDTLPEGATFSIDEELGAVKLSYSTNGVDGCLGNPLIHVVVHLSNHTDVDLYAQSPQ